MATDKTAKERGLSGAFFQGVSPFSVFEAYIKASWKSLRDSKASCICRRVALAGGAVEASKGLAFTGTGSGTVALADDGGSGGGGGGAGSVDA